MVLGLAGAQLSCARVCALACLFAWSGAAFAQSAPTTTTLAITSGGSAVTTVTSGTVVTLTATVLAGTAPVTVGQVKFCDASATYCEDIHIVGTAQLTSAGSATYKFRPGVGSHSYKAVFVGTPNGATAYAASTSSAAALSVTGLSPSITTLAVSPGPSSNTYTLTATVGGNGSTAPTGTVSFLNASNGNAVLGTATLGAGTAGASFLNTSNVGSAFRGVSQWATSTETESRTWPWYRRHFGDDSSRQRGWNLHDDNAGRGRDTVPSRWQWETLTATATWTWPWRTTAATIPLALPPAQ